MQTIRVKIRRDPLQTAIRIILSVVCFMASFLPTWPMASDRGVILTGFQLAEASIWGMMFALTPALLSVLQWSRLGRAATSCLLPVILVLYTTAACAVFREAGPDAVRLPALELHVILILGTIVFQYLWLNRFQGGARHD